MTARVIDATLYNLFIGLPDVSSKYQCLWHNMLTYLYMHRPVLSYCHFYTGQRAKKPDSPVKYRIDGKPYLFNLYLTDLTSK